MLGFLPSLSQRLLGEDLKMPHIATWWCGQPAEKDYVLANLAAMAIAPSFGEGVPGLEDGRAVRLRPEQHDVHEVADARERANAPVVRIALREVDLAA